MERENRVVEKLETAALAGLVLWCVYPVVSMALNFAGTDVHINYNIWASVMFLDGGLGVFCGVFYLYHKVTEGNFSSGQVIPALAPVWAILVFGIWSVICSFAAKHPYAAFFGFTTMKDCIAAWFAYLGFIFLGLTVSGNRKKTLLLCNVFLGIATLLAVLSLIDNDFTAKLFVNGYTNTWHFQSVFYNTNHYSYYIAITIILAAFLAAYSDKAVKKAVYAVLYVIFIVLLVRNNTLGSWLASLLTLFFALVWSFMKGEKKRTRAELAVLFAVFLAVSFVTDLRDHCLVESLRIMFSDAEILSESVTGEVDKETLDNIGTTRGKLWALYRDVMIKYPVMGVGPENVGYSAHNNYLQIGAFTGVTGLILYFLIFMIGSVRLFKRRKEISNTEKTAAFIVVAYLIAMFFGVTMFYTAPYFYAALGFCLPGALHDIVHENHGDEQKYIGQGEE